MGDGGGRKVGRGGDVGRGGGGRRKKEVGRLAFMVQSAQFTRIFAGFKSLK